MNGINDMAVEAVFAKLSSIRKMAEEECVHVAVGSGAHAALLHIGWTVAEASVLLTHWAEQIQEERETYKKAILVACGQTWMENLKKGGAE